MATVLKNLLLYVWQLPQNLLGLLFLLFIRNEKKHILAGVTFYQSSTFPGGISLGQYIIMGYATEKDVKHEFGHCIQSKILGWFYLPIVGLLSLLHAWIHDCKAIGKTYYHYWTEKWADKLAGVKR